MHIPVLQKEVLKYLDPKPNQNFIDATLGEAGHALAILERNGPKGKVLGIDRDPEMIERVKSKAGSAKRLISVCGNFANLKEIVRNEKFSKVSGILFDLGMTSWHLEESGRGFSFQKQEPLDMRYDSQNQLTAEKIVNYWSGFEIERILAEYGEEQFSKQIAKEIIESRKIKPIETTSRLVEVVRGAAPSWYQRQRIHFATKTFQALRIAVNDELGALKSALPQATDIILKGGRIAVISFHSLEDRIVKNFFKEKLSMSALEILTKKPITPSFEEIKSNPRSRSAKLRVASKTN